LLASAALKMNIEVDIKKIKINFEEERTRRPRWRTVYRTPVIAGFQHFYLFCLSALFIYFFLVPFITNINLLGIEA